LALVDALFGFPGMTTRIATDLLGVSDTAALENIMKLVDVGILSEIPIAGRKRLFAAREIIEIIDRAEAVPNAPIARRRESS
jgi:hypothetical protein